MLPVAPIGRTIQVTLTGTPTAIDVPDGIDVYEVRGTGTGSWTFRFLSGDPGYPVLANVEAQIPVQVKESATAVQLFVAGSGTLVLVLYGIPKPTP